MTVELAAPLESRTDTATPAVAVRPISFGGRARNRPLSEPAIQCPSDSAIQPRSSSPEGRGWTPPVPLAEGEGVAEAEGVGDVDAEADGVADAEADGEAEAEAVGEGAIDPEGDGESDG